MFLWHLASIPIPVLKYIIVFFYHLLLNFIETRIVIIGAKARLLIITIVPFNERDHCFHVDSWLFRDAILGLKL